MKADLFHCFANGSLAASGNQWALADAPWTEHKDFPGVFLKNLAGPELTQGLLTCHLVRIEALQKIGRHTHGQRLELHELVPVREIRHASSLRLASRNCFGVRLCCRRKALCIWL